MPRNAEVVYVVLGTEEFREVARKLREAGNVKLTRKLRAKMRKAGDPMLREARGNVMRIASSGIRGGGSAARAAHVAGRSRRLTERVQERIIGHSGLRAATAAATTLEVKLAGRNVGVRLVCKLNRMPRDQRKLPVHMNTGKWRHPVHADASRPRDEWGWTTQIVTPPGWFSDATEHHGPRVREGTAEAVNEINVEIAR